MIAEGGNNAFYTRRDVAELPTLDTREAYREEDLRNEWSGTTAAEQWETVKDLPFVTVD
jgi:hypothetical protein